MRKALFVSLFVLSSLACAEGGRKRGYTNQQYSQGYQSGATQSGVARSERDVTINDGADQTQVIESRNREHRYQTSSPYGSTSGRYANNGGAQRNYYHYGDPTTKQRIQSYETQSISIGNRIDALYTRAERCKNTLNQNPVMTKAERKGFEREIALISYEIGQVGEQLGTRAFSQRHPDAPSDMAKIQQDLFDLMWSQSPHTYNEVFLEARLKTVNWQLTYLAELQKSLSTPFAEYKAQDNRDVHGEIKRDLEDIRRRLDSIRR